MARSLAEREDRPVGLVLREAAVGAGLPGLVEKTLPGEASDYARLLFATLHDLDDEGVCAIVVQDVPDEPAWWAVADRLARASTAAR